jgi:hypothetical protein
MVKLDRAKNRLAEAKKGHLIFLARLASERNDLDGAAVVDFMLAKSAGIDIDRAYAMGPKPERLRALRRINTLRAASAKLVKRMIAQKPGRERRLKVLRTAVRTLIASHLIRKGK